MPSIFKLIISAIMVLAMCLTITLSAPTDLVTHDFETTESVSLDINVRSDTATDMADYYTLHCAWDNNDMWSGVMDEPLTKAVCEDICSCGLLMGNFGCAPWQFLNNSATSSWCYLYFGCSCYDCDRRKRDIESNSTEGTDDAAAPPRKICGKRTRSVLEEALAKANDEYNHSQLD